MVAYRPVEIYETGNLKIVYVTVEDFLSGDFS